MLKVLICHIFYEITLMTRTQLIWEMLLELTEERTKLILQEFRQAKQVYGTSAIAILGLAVEWDSKWVGDSLEKVVVVVKTEQAKPQLCHVGYSPDRLHRVHQKTTKPIKLPESWEPIVYEEHLQHKLDVIGTMAIAWHIWIKISVDCVCGVFAFILILLHTAVNFKAKGGWLLSFLCNSFFSVFRKAPQQGYHTLHTLDVVCW